MSHHTQTDRHDEIRSKSEFLSAAVEQSKSGHRKKGMTQHYFAPEHLKTYHLELI